MQRYESVPLKLPESEAMVNKSLSAKTNREIMKICSTMFSFFNCNLFCPEINAAFINES